MALAGRYRIVEEIGRGGTSIVFRAEDLRHHRHVAVKVLHPEVTAELGRERFLREIDFVASLAHPHILPLYESGEMDGLLFYVSPLLEGETLRDRLARDRNRMLPVEEALRIGGEILDALAYAHAHGVLHRDIKPANILMADHHAYISDFGVARALEEGGGKRLTATGIVVGTPSYMSPEQASGKPLDHRSDLYAAACVIYETLCGEPPFASRTAQVAMARRLTEEPRSLRTTRPSVPEEVDLVLRRSLSRLPADRFASASEFKRELLSPSPTRERASPRIGSEVPADNGRSSKWVVFWQEMRRRKVWSAVVIYGSVWAAAFGLAAGLNDLVVLSDETAETLARAVLGLGLAGFLLTLALAWIFEISEEGSVNRTGAWVEVDPDSNSRWPLLTRGAVIAAAVLMALMIIWYAFARPLLSGGG